MTEPVSAEKVSEAAAQLRVSAGAVERSVDLQTETAIRRTVLAGDRTVLALERTYAAWLRTGLGALASGVGAHALFGDTLPRWLTIFVGIALLLFADGCFVIAAWRQLRPPPLDPKPEMSRLPAVVTIALSGLLIAASAIAMVEILFGQRT